MNSAVVEVARNPLAMMIAMAGDYDNIAHYKIGPQHLFLFNHPDLIRDVLVTNQKNFHKSRGLERRKQPIPVDSSSAEPRQGSASEA